MLQSKFVNYRDTFMKELALWQKLRHPNIVQFLGVLNNSDRLIFLTEYLCNVSFTELIYYKSIFFFVPIHNYGFLSYVNLPGKFV